MTGGRAYLLDPGGRRTEQLHAPSVGAIRVGVAARERTDGTVLVAELRRLLEDHAEVGSDLAARLLAEPALPLDDFWLVEPVAATASATGTRARVGSEELATAR